MVQVKLQRRPGLLEGLLILTILSPISQVHASVFGRSQLYDATNVRDSHGVAYPQEPALLRSFGLYPRAYNLGISLPMESSWRYTGGGSGPNAGINLGLFRRQDEEVESYCNQGMHVCRALGKIGCCGNDAYCIVTSEGEGKCCPLGSRCNEDPCSMTQTLCTQVVTITPTGTQTVAEPTTTTNTGCCVRPCAYTMHLCDEKFGGFCCGNDSVCVPNKMCRATPSGNLPTTTVPTKTTFTTEQCSTGSFACAEAAGGGCCPDKMICTEINSTAGCAISGSGVRTREIFTNDSGPTGSADAIVTDPPTETPSLTGDADGAADTNTGGDDSGSDVVTSESDSGLSAGAKAGIGIGAAVGVLSLIALGAFFFIRHRKQTTANGVAELPPPPPNQDPQMGQYGGYGQPGPYYAGGTQYPQGYYPAPQASPQIGPVQGYYDPSEAMKYPQQPQLAEAYGGPVQPQPETSGGAVLLPNTEHRQSPTELPENVR